ncbi:MAG: ABC-2 transporter permease [Patescibacteria group bacterium]|nr:ABC-2 transporter permease [Patescibacteria group bacterium]
MRHLLLKEMGHYLNNPFGYITVVLFSVFVNFFFIRDLFISSTFSLRPFFYLLPWFNMIYIPALTMRAFSEEKRVGTYEVLLTLPVKEREILLAKFFSILGMFSIGLVLTCGILFFITFFSQLNFLELFIAYLGQILLAALFISINLYLSLFSPNQIIVFLLGVIINFFLVVMSTDFISSVIPRFILDQIIIFAPIYHLDSFSKGVIRLSSLVYFLSFIFLFLSLSLRKIMSRN